MFIPLSIVNYNRTVIDEYERININIPFISNTRGYVFHQPPPRRTARPRIIRDNPAAPQSPPLINRRELDERTTIIRHKQWEQFDQVIIDH